MARKKVDVKSPVNKDNYEKVKNLADVANNVASSEDKSQSSIDRLIKDLIFLGRLSRDVKVSGYTFKINTLTEERQRILVSRIMRMTDEEKIAYAKVYTVSEVVSHIDDVEINQITNRISENSGVKEENEEVAKINFFGRLQAAIVDILFEEYEDLLKESRKDIGYENVKK